MSQKLSNKATSSKAYCSILKTFLNDKIFRLFLLYFIIMNLLLILKKKPNFSIHLLQSNVHYQIIIVSYQKVCYFLLKNILSNFQIYKHDPITAHGHDMISIRILKLCGPSLSKLISVIFKSSLSQMKFFIGWKKGNVVTIHKNGDKQCIKNYWPVSLLPICSKIFERLLFKNCTIF